MSSRRKWDNVKFLVVKEELIHGVLKLMMLGIKSL